MYISDDYVSFVALFEGVSPEAYYDTGGVLTIGIGHTSQSEMPFTKDSIWEPEQIRDAFELDIKEAVERVHSLLIQEVPQEIFDMSVDMVFNCGGAPTYFKLLNQDDYEGARDQLLRWIYDNGKVQLGLVKRCFARYMYFTGEPWQQFANCNASRGNLDPLNKLIEPLGYRLVTAPKTNYKLQRIA